MRERALKIQIGKAHRAH